MLGWMSIVALCAAAHADAPLEVAVPADALTPLGVFDDNVQRGATHRPHQVLVQTRSVADRAALLSDAAPWACRLDRQFPGRPWFVLDCPAAPSVRDVIAGLQDAPVVRWVEAGFYQSLDLVPDDLESQQWHHDNYGQRVVAGFGTPGADIGSVDAWDQTIGNPDIVVAVIDLGVYLDHEDLAGQEWVNAGEICGNGFDDDGNGYVDDCVGWDVGDGDNDIDPTALTGDPCVSEHGTFISGLVGAIGDNGTGVAGVAWDVAIMGLKMADDATCTFTTIDAAEGVLYALDNGADILNLSFSSSGYSFLFESAMQDADAAGLISVMSAGNDGLDVDTSVRYPNHYDLDHGIIVANTTNRDELSGSSNYGADLVDLAAPGDDLYSTTNVSPTALGVGSGTSYAAPLVAGGAALIWSLHPELEAAEVKQAIRDGATPLSELDCALTEACVNTGGRLSLPGALDAAAALADTSLADLVMPRVTVVGEPPVSAGDPLTVKVRSRNVGDADATSYRLSIRLSEDAVVTSADPEVCSVSVARLGAGRMRTTTLPCVRPATAFAGGYVGAIIDVDEQVDERYENNNTQVDPSRLP